MNGPTDPSPEKPEEAVSRREFLQKVGKAVVYTAPVVAYIASSNRAVAMSGFVDGE